MSLAYLYDPNKQFIDRNGGLNVGGFLRVYLNGTDDHATTYKNFEGSLNDEDIVLDNNGRAVVICEESQYYRIEVYNRSGGLLWTQYPIKPESGSSSLQRINIFSSDHSVDVEETYDEHTDSFNVDLGVKYENLPDKPTIPPAPVQSDWAEYDDSSLAFIQNKPENLVQDADYVHTDNNFTDNDKDKLGGIEAGAEKNVQADWNQTNTLALDFIKNKPDIHGSCLLTPISAWQTLDGTDKVLRYVWSSGTPTAVTGDKIRLATAEGQTNYRVEVAALGAYRIDVSIYVKWDGTPVNKTGKIFGFAVDFSRHFEAAIGRSSNIIKVPYNQQAYYGFGFQVPSTEIDAPNGVKFAIQALVEYLGPVPEAT